MDNMGHSSRQRSQSPETLQKHRREKKRHKSRKEKKRLNIPSAVQGDDDERLVSTETEALESVVPALPPAQQSASTTERDGWTRTSGIKTDVDPESDYFSSLGTEMRGQAARDAADKERARRQEEQRASSSIVRLGAGDPNYNPDDDCVAPPSKPVIGGPGYQWRMTKLKRTYEAAAEENRSVEEIAIERYGSLAAWEDAREESRVMEGPKNARQENRRDSRASIPSTPGREGLPYNRKYVFSAEKDSRNQAAFRRPMSGRDTPDAHADSSAPASIVSKNKRVDLLRQQSSSKFGSPVSSGPSSPVPSALNPLASGSPFNRQLDGNSKTGGNVLDLNKLQAALMKANMMNPAAVPDLEQQYEAALKYQRQTVSLDRTEVVPTLDGRGRMYDVGFASTAEPGPSKPGNRRRQEAKFETRDPKTGALLRYNADDDRLSLQDLVKQERFQAGSADHKDMDSEMARSIMTDAKFENDLDYIDDNADRLAKKKMKTDASKRLFAINDYSRTQKALDSCQFCYQDDGNAPKVAVISSGTKVYLCCPQFEELVEGHCWIVPIQHVLCSLESDDDVWDEIKNYMKCLMRMFSEERDQGIVFYETVLSFKQQRHTYIEAVPLPWALFHDAPAYFRESIMTSESEWSQHKKLIDFSVRPGGFRRSMVSNLPYFMVQWDYKGQSGYGHVVEGNDESSGQAGQGENGEKEMTSIVDEEGQGGKFPKYFAAEIIGNILGLEPRKWRKPRRIPQHLNEERVNAFLHKLGYQKYDWTGLLTE